jgi:chloramphenicol O-acetyltransferase
MDDSLNNLDNVNFKNLIEICNTLPFQIIAVYQSRVEIEGIKQFLVTRQNGESKID